MIKRKWSWYLPEFELGLNTGIRQGSQYGLTPDMIDWKGRMLNILRTKNDEPVHVPLNDAAVAAFRVVHARGDGKGVCTVQKDGRTPLTTGSTGSTTR